MPNRSPNHTSKHAAILVTGASGGIGLATALRLCADGAKVFAGVRSVETARMLRAAHGPALHPVILDVTQPDSCASAMQEVTEALAGRHLTALVNNAGIAVQGPLETLPLDELTAQFEVNLFGVARMVQAALPLLRQAAIAGERVSIVNVGSIGGRIPIPFNGPYNASKFALVGYDGALRQELRPWGIRVVLVEPGTTRTAIWGKVEASVEQSLGDGRQIYGPMLERYRASVQALQRSGKSPDYVAERIVRLIASRSPAHRVLVGDARMMALLTWLPTRLRDHLMARGLGLPGRGALSRTRT
jgi:NAD(P)-dependent dehydrogenase (short-subunit alcohol dehydrogenase family)